ncbi:MAG: Uma2 family endonuclease [Mesorhizobium sp.]|nr:Uma2 family endonuclease [Mesorhizobium sp.]
MNIQSKPPTTPDEFLRWNEGREGKREFVRGRVEEMMVGVSKYHAVVVARLIHQINLQLGLKEYVTSSAEFGVVTAGGVRYPDVMVDRMAGAGTDLAANEPLLIAEVLSLSSYTRDFGEKVIDYGSVDSLLHYLVLSQDEARVWVWSRETNGTWGGPVQHAEPREPVSLTRLNLSIDIGAIYSGPFDKS